MRLSDLRDKYTKYLWNSEYPETTVRGYITDAKQFIEFLEELNVTTVDKITQKHVTLFLQNLQADGYAPRSVSHKINAIKVLFAYMFDQGLINDNFVADIKHPKQEDKPPRILTDEELAHLREVVADDARYIAILETLLQTGMKIGELAKLQIGDVILNPGPKYGEVHVHERNKTRKIPINNAMEDVMGKYLKERPDSEYQNVFLTKNGRPVAERNIRRKIQEYFKKAGITDIMVNDLRNTFIAHQLIKGMSVGRVAYLVGYKNLNSMNKFIEVLGDKYKPEIEETIEVV